MSIIGSSWKDEATPEEEYGDITGEEFSGSRKDLEKRISRKLEDSYTGKSERSKLRDLQERMKEGE